MKRILIVKVTSMGDVIQAQPIVSDLKRAFPGVEVDWAVDESFAEIARWNPGIDRVLCAPLRRFKKARRWADFKAIAQSISELRAHRYDVAVDIHGVYKSAIIAFLSRSRRRLGYRSKDLGERGAAFAYTGRFVPPRDRNAWSGMRETVSTALGYPLDGPADYNLHIPAPAKPLVDTGGRPLAMLFHAASKDDKKWPAEHWIAIARELVRRGFYVAVPWGSAAERAEGLAIVNEVDGAELLPQLSVTEIAQVIAASDFVIGVDTGFVHLAHALQKRTVMIFIATSRETFGNNVPFRSVSIGDGRSVPPVAEALAAIDHVHADPLTQNGQGQSVAAA
ncbi:lipopolysaccharide heptosyltransferase I [Paraburkholderia sp. LEh10]|uniref:lipopolysaccharide heptosyltransferase I n=1 Tax=Paraburkholderia sp. LEh10 TaxID=2821353 RepID=UPI001AE42310|nr:lipopolysaccharide heptosyltransferase I [Paraburkholderia sp. LEh10]MBP0595902.1 lipopolysaccharide heptosyltransferase I [Paraburkholderia sp. LEh10]